MEQVQRERSEREARQRIEDMRARKEDKVFLSGIEKGKVVEGIRKKREEKNKTNGKGENGADQTTATATASTNTSTLPDDIQVRRIFRQKEAKQRKESEDDNFIAPDAQRVLGKIF